MPDNFVGSAGGSGIAELGDLLGTVCVEELNLLVAIILQDFCYLALVSDGVGIVERVAIGQLRLLGRVKVKVLLLDGLDGRDLPLRVARHPHSGFHHCAQKTLIRVVLHSVKQLSQRRVPGPEILDKIADLPAAEEQEAAVAAAAGGGSEGFKVFDYLLRVRLEERGTALVF